MTLNSLVDLSKNYDRGGGEMGWNSSSPYEQGQRSMPVGMLQVREEVKVHGATVVGMMSSGLVSSLHGEDRVVS